MFRRLYYSPTARSVFLQVAVVGTFTLLCVMAYQNMVEALTNRLGVRIGFDFVNQAAGFNIGDSVIPYEPSDSFGRAILVGLTNTLFLGLVGVVLMLVFGTILAVARLSQNRILSNIGRSYIAFFRNMPPILVLVFWFAVPFSNLPLVRDSFMIFEGAFTIAVNNRGFFFPALSPGENFALLWIGSLVLIALVMGRYTVLYLQSKRTGRQPLLIKYLAVAFLAIPLTLALLVPDAFLLELPEIGRFNITGGASLSSNFLIALSGLVMYQSVFAAEAIRTGIQSLDRGQIEAASALGLSGGSTMRLIILPQALRVSIPPLISNCIGFIKNSSLCVAVGYPELFSVVGQTIANQSGRAVECFTIIMICYLSISLALSALINLYDRYSSRYLRDAR